MYYDARYFSLTLISNLSETSFAYTPCVLFAYYDPDLGRFLQADPMLDGLNRYTYCGNNPIRYNDPTGFEAVPTTYGDDTDGDGYGDGPDVSGGCLPNEPVNSGNDDDDGKSGGGSKKDEGGTETTVNEEGITETEGTQTSDNLLLGSALVLFPEGISTLTGIGILGTIGAIALIDEYGISPLTSVLFDEMVEDLTEIHNISEASEIQTSEELGERIDEQLDEHETGVDNSIPSHPIPEPTPEQIKPEVNLSKVDKAKFIIGAILELMDR
ncbi:MAG: RHS repeat-associated core domain-containing protein [Spirochaetaceae bacterium]|nr:RHS repeat-associated core domain-containing protein [Spirochaetaceae bacterium]